MQTDPNTIKNILIVDDHPMNVDSYKTLLDGIEANRNAAYYLKYDCKEAYQLLQNLKRHNETVHYAFIDVNLPPFEEMKIRSGEDLAIEIRKEFPKCKIVIISMYKEPLWVNQILKSVNPEGFVAKSDINHESFIEIFHCIERKQVYFSKSIEDSQKVMTQKNINWDEYDSKILQLIAEGIKTNQLPNYIPLSLSAIEKRKANLKKQLVFDSGTDKHLVEVAKKLGLIYRNGR
jgi:DNA-binding NarL/FixJ family response regulator